MLLAPPPPVAFVRLPPKPVIRHCGIGDTLSYAPILRWTINRRGSTANRQHSLTTSPPTHPLLTRPLALFPPNVDFDPHMRQIGGETLSTAGEIDIIFPSISNHSTGAC